MTPLPTQTLNALRKANITQPQHESLHSLSRIPGIGRKNLAVLALWVYDHKNQLGDKRSI